MPQLTHEGKCVKCFVLLEVVGSRVGESRKKIVTQDDLYIDDLYIKDASGRNPNPTLRPHAGLIGIAAAVTRRPESSWLR